MSIEFHVLKRLIRAFGLVLLLSGCGTMVDWNYPRTPSTAFEQPQILSHIGHTLNMDATRTYKP